MRCVELRDEKLFSLINILWTLSSALPHKYGTPFNDVASQPSMTTSINTKELVKFGTSEMRSVELRAEKLYDKHNI